MNKKIKGSGVLVVIISTIIVIIYSTSTYLTQNHFEYISSKYKEVNKIKYEKDINNIEEIYEKVVQQNRYNEIIGNN